MKFTLFISILAGMALQLPIVVADQPPDNSGIASAQTFLSYNYSYAGKPTFYELATPLNEAEMHIFEPLSQQERQGIAAETDPPAIGIARNLKAPVIFNLSNIEIPEQGEITVSGGRLVRENADLLVFTTLLKSQNAHEIRIFMAEGNFPHGVSLNLFGKGQQAFSQTGIEGKISAYGFYTSTIFSDSVILQLVIPSVVFDKDLYFEIPMIIHVDEDFNHRINYRDCFEDVNCDEAGLFPLTGDLKKSIARLIFFVSPYYYVCSGGLLNDVRLNDFQPFLLTASHCINSQSAAVSVEARFDYFTMSCNGEINQETVILNGSNLMATNGDTDFTLLLLHEQPCGSRVYLGWSTTAVENDEILHSVHHPSGTTQKYTRHQNKTAPVNLCSGAPTDKYYYTRTQAGQAGGGSSGGTLVRSDGRVAGQLRSTCLGSGYNPCNYNTYYHAWGRFEESYSNNNLQFWLAAGGSSVSISISNSYLDFGEVHIGDSDSINIVVSNNGLTTQYLNLELNAVNITGIHAAEFHLASSGNLYLPPGASGNLDVVFTPLYAGIKTAILEIFHNADNVTSPLVVNLSGTATGQAVELPLQNMHIFPGQNLCFGATQTILLAGDNSYFIVENESITELIAGHNILIEYGTHVQAGADFLARITTTGSFCNSVSPTEVNVKTETSPLPGSNTCYPEKSAFVIFPNPTPGRITIYSEKDTGTSTIKVDAYNMVGTKLLSLELAGASQYQPDLTDLPPGIYILRIMSGIVVSIEKLIRL